MALRFKEVQQRILVLYELLSGPEVTIRLHHNFRGKTYGKAIYASLLSCKYCRRLDRKTKRKAKLPRLLQPYFRKRVYISERERCHPKGNARTTCQDAPTDLRQCGRERGDPCSSPYRTRILDLKPRRARSLLGRAWLAREGGRTG